MKKSKIKYIVLLGLLLCKSGSFGASEATKKLIHETLAKYGISAGGKEVCGTPLEPKYDNGIIKCNSYKANGYRANNYWVPSDRLCKHCPIGTILNKQTFQSCNEIECENDLALLLPKNGKCPEGYELIKITNGKCPDGYELVDLTENCPEGYEKFNNK